MRIARTSDGGDFYVSFCDLVLSLLIIFLVITLALTLRVHETVKKLDHQSETVISPKRFTGAAGTTKFDFCLLQGTLTGLRETTVVFFPTEVAAKWEQTRAPNVSDPVLDVCRHYREKTLLLMTAADFVKMAGGLTTEPTLPDLLNCPALFNSQLGDVVMRLMLLEQRNPSAVTMSPEQLRDSIGGTFLYASREQGGGRGSTTTAFNTASQAYAEWLDGLRRGEAEVIRPFNEASRDHTSSPARGIRFSVSDDRSVRIGSATFSVEQFKAMLAALLPGRSFIIEHIDPRNGQAIPAPEWFEREVLFAAGYDGRVLKANVDK